MGSESLRILNVVNNLSLGGTQRAACVYACGYAQRGHESAMLTTLGEGPRIAELERSQVPVISASELGRERALAKVAEGAFDVVHFHQGIPEDVRMDPWLPELRKHAKLVVSTNVFAMPTLGAGARSLDIEYVLSQMCFAKWQAWGGGSGPIGIVVPYPVDINAFSRVSDAEIAEYRAQLGIPDGAIVMGRVGQPIDAKWSAEAPEAFRLCVDQGMNAYFVTVGAANNVRQVIAGWPDDLKSRTRQIESIGSDVELSKLYSSLDVFLHSATIGESFGLVFAEAALCGSPLVCLATPLRDNTQVETAKHGERGLIAHTAEGLARCVRQLVEDPALKKRLTVNAREYVLHRFASDLGIDFSLQVMQTWLQETDRKDSQRRVRESFRATPDAFRNCLDYPAIDQPSVALRLKSAVVHTRAYYWARSIKRKLGSR